MQYTTEEVRTPPSLDPRSGPGIATKPLSPFAATALVLRRWRLLALCAFLGALAGFVPSILKDRTFTANASFMPQGQRQLSQISGLAAQFGLAVPTGEAGFSPPVYADLI